MFVLSAVCNGNHEMYIFSCKQVSERSYSMHNDFALMTCLYMKLNFSKLIILYIRIIHKMK